MKLFAVRGERLEGERKKKYSIKDKIHNQSTASRNFLLMPKKKGGFFKDL